MLIKLNVIIYENVKEKNVRTMKKFVDMHDIVI